MSVDAISPLGAVFPRPDFAGARRKDDSPGSLAGLLAAAKPANDGKRQLAEKIRARPDEISLGAPEVDTLFIREHGFAAYAERLQEQKLEKLRAEILEKMGLTEEKLAALPTDARRAVEDMIKTEIRERLSAEKTLENLNGGPAGVGFGQAVTQGAPGVNADPPAQRPAPATAPANTRIGAAFLALLNAQEQRDAEQSGPGPGQFGQSA